MVRLYLLGFTHDLKGVVFGQRRGGKTAAFWIPIDEKFLDAIDKLERARQEAADEADKSGKRGKGKARSARAREEEKERVVLPPVGRSQSTSGLPAAEIQQMLRQGRTVNAVVEAAKAPRAWVERLMEPVMAERIGVVRLAQRSMMTRPRLGRSGLMLGDAVVRNLEERRATADTIEGLDDAWDARASTSGRWRVWIKFNHRGKRRTAEWEFRKDTRALTPRNRLAAQLGWWEPEAPAAPEGSETPEGGEAQPQEESEGAKARRPAKRRAAPKRGRARKAAPRKRTAGPRGRAGAKRAPRRKTSKSRPGRKSQRRRP